MKRSAIVLALGIVVSLLAMPVSAQEADPYGSALPGNVQRPADVTAPPDAAPARDPGAVVSAGRAVNPAAVVPAARAVSRPVPARELPRTGSDLTVGALLGALVLLTGGAAVLTVARRRARHNA